jgi:hypothetical protein
MLQSFKALHHPPYLNALICTSFCEIDVGYIDWLEFFSEWKNMKNIYISRLTSFTQDTIIPLHYCDTLAISTHVHWVIN